MAVLVVEVEDPDPSVPLRVVAAAEKHEAHEGPVKMEVDR
jgi:hypothetical protein